MKISIDKISKNKSEIVKEKIIDGLCILESVGVPLDDLTSRRLEKMSMSFLALCCINPESKWGEVKSISDSWTLTTREIITYINEHFEENISPGSYDDIRRKDLIRIAGMGLVIKSANNLNADRNDGTRGYAITEELALLVKSFKSKNWTIELNRFEIDQEYIDQFKSTRKKEKLTVQLEEGVTISLHDGPHNQIQKSIIEEFLPIYGYNSTVLYVGDTSEKQLHKNSKKMKELGLNIDDRGMLPDIVAFSETKKWLYLIEAVHSSNPLNAERCIELSRTLLNKCPYGVVFVTAFLSRKDFAKWMPQIAWETEVWLADNPNHMIHFNGDKFFGPHSSPPKHEL